MCFLFYHKLYLLMFSLPIQLFCFFFLKDTAPPEISTLPLHDPLPIPRSPIPPVKTSVPRPPSTVAWAPMLLRIELQKRAIASAALESWSRCSSRVFISELICDAPSTPASR